MSYLGAPMNLSYTPMYIPVPDDIPAESAIIVKFDREATFEAEWEQLATINGGKPLYLLTIRPEITLNNAAKT
jgi:hypothetical protein